LDPSLSLVLKSRSYLPSLRNSEAATSMPTLTLPVKPAASIAWLTRLRPSSFEPMLGAKPPSSPPLQAS